jgi:3-hydroxyisobutyrate dehydrogenase
MQQLGFIGLGTMGAPIAGRLLAAGTPLVLWNRTAAKCAPLAAAGASVAGSPASVFARCETVLSMLTDVPALDAVLGRGTPAFAARVRGRLLVSLSTVPAEASAALGRDIAAAGGQYVEAPVSGSRRPAELGQLIAMVAGEEAAAARVQALLAPACRESVFCGPVPNGLLMKHATNLVLIPTMISLTEAAAFVRAAGLSAEAFARTLLAGQMASDLLRAKVPKLVAGDFAPHSSVANVLLSAEAARAAVRGAGSGEVLIEACLGLLAQASQRGLGDQDVLALSTLQRKASSPA